MSDWGWSRAIALAVAPGPVYRTLLSTGAAGSWPRASRTPILIAALLGIVTSIAATGRITLSLALSGLVCWSFVPLLQMATAAALVASVRERPVSLTRGIELLFAGHGPWSLWLVAIAALQLISPAQSIALASAVVPAVFTARILSAFGREVLALSPQAARARMFAHQAATTILIVTYVQLTTQLSSRISGWFG